VAWPLTSGVSLSWRQLENRPISAAPAGRGCAVERAAIVGNQAGQGADAVAAAWLRAEVVEHSLCPSGLARMKVEIYCFTPSDTLLRLTNVTSLKRRHIGSTGKIEICVLIFRGNCHCYHPSTAAILGSTKVVTWWNSPKKSFQNGPVVRRGKNQGYPAYTSR
jgi:hypothetical protein